MTDMLLTGAHDTLFVVACVQEKHDRVLPARELYRSDWWAKARRLVEAAGTPWLIVSAEHGLLDPCTPIAPYDRWLARQPRAERDAFAAKLAGQVRARDLAGRRCVLLAGRPYREALAPALAGRFASVEAPMAGLGLGEQKRWLRLAAEAIAALPAAA